MTPCDLHDNIEARLEEAQKILAESKGRSWLLWPVIVLLASICLAAIGYVGSASASNDRVDGVEKRVDDLKQTVIRGQERIQDKLDTLIQAAKK